jgi:hypothetical protein
MSDHIKAALILALPLLMIGTALGGEGVQVKITNDGTTGHCRHSVRHERQSSGNLAAKCGHADTLGVRNDSAVNVHADSSCEA